MRMAIAVTVLCLGAGAALGLNNSPTGGTLGYTCDSVTKTCTCTGPADCYEMGQGHDCDWRKKPVCNGDTCTCDWFGK
jgi:hypothetical protein